MIPFIMAKQITTPVLLIAFNRPDTTETVFQKISDARPTKLYVAVDGPRQNKIGEDRLVEKVKKIIKNVNWQCEVQYKFNEKNKGAEVTVSSAVTWALEDNECVIVLEDDIIAPFSFLSFAQQMLIRYAKNENVYMVSGCQWTPIDKPNNDDYLFGIYGHTWGWATWKRAWEKNDLFVNDFDKYLQGDSIKSLVKSEAEKKYWQKKFKT